MIILFVRLALFIFEIENKSNNIFLCSISWNRTTLFFKDMLVHYSFCHNFQEKDETSLFLFSHSFMVCYPDVPRQEEIRNNAKFI